MKTHTELTVHTLVRLILETIFKYYANNPNVTNTMKSEKEKKSSKLRTSKAPFGVGVQKKNLPFSETQITILMWDR